MNSFMFIDLAFHIFEYIHILEISCTLYKLCALYIFSYLE